MDSFTHAVVLNGCKLVSSTLRTTGGGEFGKLNIGHATMSALDTIGRLLAPVFRPAPVTKTLSTRN